MENNYKKRVSSSQIIFNVTDNIKKLGIKEFTLKDRDFLIKWEDGRSSWIEFKKSSSLSQNIKQIRKTLEKELKGKNIDGEKIENAIKDIEDQLVKRRDEIYSLNKTKTSDNEFKSTFLTDVSNLRTHFATYADPYLEWQNEVNKKYKILEYTINKIYPNTLSIIQFIMCVKTILNIEGNKLPFFGIIIALPSSLKTTFINFFRIYNHTFYSDIFTPNSLVSHNASLSEEQLREIDMLPKIKDKLVLIPEMAPLFTVKEDDLHKILGTITRLVDGDGLESDSGAHGHRGYPPTMFSWIGAVVEIPPKIWKILSQLGFKIYFFRPDLPEKSVDDLVNIALDNKISEKNEKIPVALIEYLQVFDAAPITNVTTLDENGIVKVKWNSEIITKNEQHSEQYRAIKFIAKIAKLLASLRGDVYVYQLKSRQSTKQDVSDVEENATQQQQISYQTEQLDYETDSVLIEDPSRATIQLRNLALANAISQGRNYIKTEDVKLVIKVALSTTRVTRKKVFELLLKEKGNLTTSKIVNELGLSEPTARKTMREFQALGIANVSLTSSYANSELTLILNDKFRWFLSEEFQSLRDDKTTTSVTTIHNQSNTEYRRMYLPFIAKTLSNSYYYTIQHKACDNRPCDSIDCHTLKENLPPETAIKNKNNVNTTTNEGSTNSQSTENEHIKTHNFKKTENNNKQETENNINNFKDSKLDKCSIKDFLNTNTQKNTVSLGPENFQHVTVSHEICHTVMNLVNEMLDVIKNESGSISLGYALQLACQKSEIVKDYLKDEKLTARDSRKVRNLFVEINRHPNIKVVKKKPQLVVKWIEQEKEKVLVNN